MKRTWKIISVTTFIVHLLIYTLSLIIVSLLYLNYILKSPFLKLICKIKKNKFLFENVIKNFFQQNISLFFQTDNCAGTKSFAITVAADGLFFCIFLYSIIYYKLKTAKKCSEKY